MIKYKLYIQHDDHSDHRASFLKEVITMTVEISIFMIALIAIVSLFIGGIIGIFTICMVTVNKRFDKEDRDENSI